MEIYKRHRPTKFKDMIGQDSICKTLAGMVKSDTVPHATLFTGPSGCGKTTLARILRGKLGCGDGDFMEINAAESRGIDMVRGISQYMRASPVHGTCRVWLLDECFHKNTLIATPTGNRLIGSILVGDVIQSINGPAVVRNAFKNKVVLNRIVRISLSNGTVLYTTKQHEFLTSNGWVAAEYLQGDCIFSVSRHTMGKGEHSHADLCFLQKRVYKQEQGQSPQLLFQKLWGKAASTQFGKRRLQNHTLRRMRQEIKDSHLKSEKILQFNLCRQLEYEKAGTTSKAAQPQSSEKDKQRNQTILQNKKGGQTTSLSFGEDEDQQPFSESRNKAKNETDQGTERFLECMGGYERGQWSNSSGTTNAIQCFKGDGLVTRAGSPNGVRSGGDGVPLQLQNRYSQPSIEIGYRGRWEFPHIEKEYLNRCQENEFANPVRVESVEVYQQGCNDAAFLGVIGDQERIQGFATFYDLQIAGHPSYFANGVAVHNCHRLSPDAQSALLKILEDTPKHVYLMLATTDPPKLLRTIRTRCSEFAVANVPVNVLSPYLHKIATLEKILMSDDVAARIWEAAEGSVRKALVILEALKDINDEDEQMGAISRADGKASGFQLAQLLLRCAQWSEISKTLKLIEDDPETVRYVVLGYMSTVLLSGGKQSKRASAIIDEFGDAFYNSKKAGLINACYLLTVGG